MKGKKPCYAMGGVVSPEEEQDPLLALKSASLQNSMAQAQNPIQGEYSPDKRAALYAELMKRQNSMPNVLAQSFAGIGDALTKSYGGDKNSNALKNTFDMQRDGTKLGMGLIDQNIADQTTTELNDPMSAKSRALQRAAAPILAAAGISEDAAAGIPAASIDGILKHANSFAEAKAKLAELKMNRNYVRQEKADALSLKTIEEAKKRAIPGFSTSGEVQISPEAAEKLRKGMEEFNTFQSKLNEYQKLIDEQGTTAVIDREAAGKMKAYAKALQISVKNMAELGVLSAADIPFIEEQIPAPGFFKTERGMQGSLKASKKMSKDKIRTQMALRGYTPDEEMTKTLADDLEETPTPPKDLAVGGMFEGKKIKSVRRKG